MGADASRLDSYESRFPRSQNALEIFSGEWTSALPDADGVGLQAGTLALYTDPRVQWAIEALGGVRNKTVLELGPLEAGHSYMLERAGATDVTAIEGNKRAFLRCLVVKEILQLRRTHFLCGDFVPYLSQTDRSFDVAIASGVLYHQHDPMRFLADIARISSAVYFWTHYFDADLIRANPSLDGKCGALVDATFEGISYQQADFRYLRALDWAGFSGGPQTLARWLPRAQILAALERFGFRRLEIAFDEPHHPNGPAFAIVARKDADATP